MELAIAVSILVAGAFLVTLVATQLAIVGLRRLDLMDRPNERSSHETPTPRGGGLAILLGLLAATGLAAFWSLPTPPWQLWAAVALVALVGLVDDVRSLPSLVRLVVHIGAACLVVAPTGLSRLPLPEPLNLHIPPELGFVLAIIWLVGVLNFVNFMDGIDGIAGLQLAIAGVAISLLHRQLEATSFWGWLGFALAAACLAFLVFNWRFRRPARIFLGDVGSASLGFLVAAAPFSFGTLGDNLDLQARTTAASLIPYVALFLWPFLADATFTLLRRLWRKEPVWRAHRSHLYQRLTRPIDATTGSPGVGHATAAAAVGAMAVLTSIAALYWHAGLEAFFLALVLFLLQWYLTVGQERAARRAA